MRKMSLTLITLLLLLGVAVGAVGFIAADLHGARDDVVLTAELLHGDPAAAEGLHLQLRNYCDPSLLWTTDYTFAAEPVCRTVFAYQNRVSSPKASVLYAGLQISAQYPHYNSKPLHAGLNAVYEEMFASMTEPGVETRVIRLADYYDTYPLYFSFDLPNAIIPTQDELSESVTPARNTWNYVYDALNTYFSIPVEEDMYAVLNLTRYDNGFSTSFGGTMVPYFESASLLTDDAIYLALNRHQYDQNGAASGVSCMGLYCLPLDRTRTGAEMVRVEALSEVYALPSEGDVEEITVDPVSGNLLLVTRHNNAYTLTVLDGITHAELQVLPLGSYPEYSLRVKEGFTVFYAADCTMTVLVLNENGTYIVAMEVNLASLASTNADWLCCNSQMAYAYDGRRLAVVSQDVTDVACGFHIAVFEDGEMTYHARYTSNLNAGTRNSNYFCQPLTYNGELGIGIDWSGATE